MKLNAKVLSSALGQSGRVAIYDIHFDANSAQIRAESAGAVEVVAQVFDQHSDLSFFVVGHTDGTGSLDHKVTLSKQHADAVVQALTTQHGIAAGRSKARGVGPLAPVGSNHTESDRALNRRVELVAQL